jgi:hypothetical protein
LESIPPTRVNPSRWNRVGTRLALIALGTLGGLALAEGAARLLWTAPWHERLVAEQGRNERLPYRRNELQLRDGPLVPRGAGTGRRVMVLGDSFPFGQGVLDETAPFPRVLERELNDEARPGSPRIEVLNAGIPGSYTAEWVDVWHRVAPVWQPDVLVIVFFLRDGTRFGTIPEFFGRVRDEIAGRNAASQLYQRSFLYRFVADRRDRHVIASRYLDGFHRAYFGSDDERAEWHAAQANVSTIVAEARASGVRVGFVVFPILVDFGDDHPFDAICDLLVEWGREHRLPTHDLRPAFDGESGPDLWVSAWDQHPNARAHRMAADSLHAFVRELLDAPP